MLLTAPNKILLSVNLEHLKMIDEENERSSKLLNIKRNQRKNSTQIENLSSSKKKAIFYPR